MKPILKINETEEEEINESENVQQKINVVKPITEIKIFSSVEEFNDYYANNKKLFEELTTCKLNKMFKVDGFKISKIKGVVSLKSIPQSRITSLMKIDDLTKRIEIIEERINQIIDFINHDSLSPGP